MATKDNLLLRNFKVSSSNQNSQLQYSNLNLNDVPGGYQRDTNILSGNQSDRFMITSKSFARKNDEYGNKHNSAMRNGCHQVQELIQKWESIISSNNIGNKKSNKVFNQQSNGSTLKLHIAPYETTIEDQKRDDDVGGRKNTKYASFEIPRQQKDDSKEPEIIQYKASQKLANPNSQQQQPTSSNDTQKHPQKKTTADSNNDVVLYSATLRDEYLKDMAEAEKRKKEAGHEKTSSVLETGYSLNPLETEKLPDDFKTDNHEYKFMRKLGQGVDGAVFEIINEKNESYACKITDQKYGIFNDIQIMRLAESIQSSHFCKVEEAGITGDSYYCIFELLGPELGKIVKEASESKLLILCKQSLEAIHDMHRLGFLHHDIHDDNFAIGRSGTAKEQTVVIYDFGFSETIKEDKTGYEKMLEGECNIYLKKDDLIEWLRMCLNWFNCNFENEYQRDEKKIRLDGCSETTKKNFEFISQLSENLKGFRWIYGFISNLKPGCIPDYSYILTTIDLMLKMSAEKLFWMPGIIYDPPHSSLKNPIESIYDKYRPPFYGPSQKPRGKAVLYMFGEKYNEVTKKNLTITFRCRGDDDTCKRKIFVKNFDPKNWKAGDIADIEKIVNRHNNNCNGKSLTTGNPLKEFDLSMFFN